VRSIFSCIIASILCTGVVAAQATAASSHKSDKSDKWEIYLGYDFDRSFGDYNGYHATEATNDNIFSAFNLNGGQVTAAYFPTKHFGVKAAYTYGRNLSNLDGSTTEQQYTRTVSYLVGPTVRWTVPNFYHNRVSVFGQQLFGAAQYSVNFENGEEGCNKSGQNCRASGFSMLSGAGVDVRLSRHFSVRPAELDYWNHQVNTDHFLGENNGQENSNMTANGFRYSAGVSAHF
jgi:hypothetical protein